MKYILRLKPDTSNSHEFELHRPSNKGTKLLLKVIKAIIIIIAAHKHVLCFSGTIISRTTMFNALRGLTN